MNSEKRSEGVGSSNPIEIILPRPDNTINSLNSGNSLLDNVDQNCQNISSTEQESEEILAACIDAGVQSR